MLHVGAAQIGGPSQRAVGIDLGDVEVEASVKRPVVGAGRGRDVRGVGHGQVVDVAGGVGPDRRLAPLESASAEVRGPEALGAVGADLGDDAIVPPRARGIEPVLERVEDGLVVVAGPRGRSDVAVSVRVDVDVADGRPGGVVGAEVGAVDEAAAVGRQLGDELVLGGIGTGGGPAAKLGLDRARGGRESGSRPAAHVHVPLAVDFDSVGPVEAGTADVRGPDDVLGRGIELGHDDVDIAVVRRVEGARRGRVARSVRSPGEIDVSLGVGHDVPDVVTRRTPEVRREVERQRRGLRGRGEGQHAHREQLGAGQQGSAHRVSPSIDRLESSDLRPAADGWRLTAPARSARSRQTTPRPSRPVRRR